MVIVEKLVEWILAGETEVLGENLSQRHFVIVYCSCDCCIFILCRVFIVSVVLCAVFHLIVVLFCVMCVICVLCLIVVPLPPGENPFAVEK
jgi:hypothetical protein